MSENRGKILAVVAAAVAVVLVVLGIAYSRSQNTPEPSPTPGPTIGLPTVTAPVDPSGSPTPSDAPTTDDPSSPSDPERELGASGDGDVEGYLPETVWTQDPNADVDHDDTHGDAEDTSAQWLPLAQAFAAAFAASDRPHDQWHADISQYLSARLAESYADPFTQEALEPTTVKSVTVAYSGETQGRVLVRFENWRQDMYLTVGPSTTSPSGWEITTVERA